MLVSRCKVLAALVGLGLALGLGACAQDAADRTPAALDGDVRAGAAAMERYGCGACHVYPGSGRDAQAFVGPPLDRWSQRSFIAGILPNNQRNLRNWIMDPDRYRPGTAMPDLGVTEVDARDIAAYLLSVG